MSKYRIIEGIHRISSSNLVPSRICRKGQWRTNGKWASEAKPAASIVDEVVSRLADSDENPADQGIVAFVLVGHVVLTGPLSAA